MDCHNLNSGSGRRRASVAKLLRTRSVGKLTPDERLPWATIFATQQNAVGKGSAL